MFLDTQLQGSNLRFLTVLKISFLSKQKVAMNYWVSVSFRLCCSLNKCVWRLLWLISFLNLAFLTIFWTLWCNLWHHVGLWWQGPFCSVCLRWLSCLPLPPLPCLTATDKPSGSFCRSVALNKPAPFWPKKSILPVQSFILLSPAWVSRSCWVEVSETNRAPRFHHIHWALRGFAKENVGRL